MNGFHYACLVCFGSPNSLMSKGVIAGVLFLSAVILSVLVGIAVTGFVWARRARRMEEEKTC